MKFGIALLALLIGLYLPSATIASQPQGVTLGQADVGPGFEPVQDPEIVQLNGRAGPFWLLDVAFSRDFETARELGGPIFVGNRVVVADRELPDDELATFTETVATNLRALEWEPTLADGPLIGDSSVWLWAQHDVDGVPIVTYTVACRTPMALAMVQTVGEAESSSQADAEALAQIVAGRLAALPIPPRPSGRYRSGEHGFSIEFPNGWERLDNQVGVVVSAVSPTTTDTGSFRSNCGVAVEPVPPGVTLDEYTDAALTSLQQATTAFQPEERTTGQLGNQTASVLVSSFIVPQLEGTRLKVVQYVALSGVRAYVLTCTAATDRFAAFRPEFESIAASFVFE